MPYEVWESSVPRILDKFTDMAVYIYGSLEDADEGARFGGSGFLVAVPHETNPSDTSGYIVSNKHVVEDCDTPTIRINRKDGTKPECIVTHQDEWKTPTDGHDIAVLPLKAAWQELNIMPLFLELFVDREKVVSEDIGIGDDTVMVGRFISHDGKQRNTPAVRFGNIAMMDGEKIVHPRYRTEQESFLIEIRSLPGYSGSGVLIYSPCAMNDMSQRRRGKNRPPITRGTGAHLAPEEAEALYALARRKGPYLLGIDFCHLQSKSEIFTGKDEMGRDIPHPYGWYVRQNSGMAAVIPAWKIHEVLKCEEFIEQRRKETERNTHNSEGVALDSVRPRATQTTPKGLEIPVRSEVDFAGALKKASRKVTSDKKSR
jgi:hypothetical protein